MRAAVAIAVVLAACEAPRIAPPCRQLAENTGDRAAVRTACAAAYDRAHRAADGIRLAEAYLADGDDARAAAIAAELTGSREGGRAAMILGQRARAHGQHDAALAHFAGAVVRAARAGDRAIGARAAYELAGAARELQRYGAALAALALARDLAARSHDARMVSAAELGRVNILRRAGAGLEAEQLSLEADRASAAGLASAPAGRDRAWFLLQLGIMYVDLGRWPLAMQSLRDALAASDDLDVAASAQLNLAFAARATGDFAAAERHLDAAATAGADAFWLALIRAQVLSDRGRLDEAAALLAGIDDGDETWGWQVAYWRGVTEARRGDRAAAERHHRAAIARLAPLRAGTGRLEAYLVAQHRAPTLALVGLLAEDGRWAEALAAVATLDVGGAPLGEAALRAAWRDRALAVVVPGGERLWRLEVRGGAVTGRDLGPAAPLEDAAERLRADPGDRAAAERLGAAIVPDDAGDAPLHLLLVGDVGRAPLAALRRAGELAIARTPLVRVLGLSPRPHAAAAVSDAVIVLADPTGDLPAARREGETVAAALATTARVGPAADRAALTAARGAAVLHVAAHVVHTVDGPVLALADGPIGAGEVAALAPAPRVVVLASCGSAAATDLGGWGSIAAGFLAAGSAAVLATGWTVTDDDAAALVAAFYRHGGARDPARALAAAQRERAAAGAPPAGWAAFTLLAAP